MNGALRTSLAGNVVLCAIVVCFIAKSRSLGRNPSRASQTEAAKIGASDQSTNLLEKPQQAGMNGFQWSQLESSDYPTYIANLRSVGCPEQTIRDIITADVDNLYAARHEQLKREESQRDLQELRREEDALLATLLDSAGRVPTYVQACLTRSQSAAVLPLTFQKVSRDRRNLTDQQLEIIDQLRQRFQAALGEKNQDPTDPIYRSRWETAQHENDELLEALLGGEFFLEYQLQASREQ